jgi:alkylated DNA repair protein alkB family protein 6
MDAVPTTSAMDPAPSAAAHTPSAVVLLPRTLDQARVVSLPSSVYYIPNFISEDEEAAILDKVASAPKPRWKQLAHRRLQTWPSDLVKNNTLLEAPLPTWLEEPVVSRLLSIPSGDDEDEDGTTTTTTTTTKPVHAHAHVFSTSPHERPNHVLINEYPPGVGIMPHKDGAAYHPVVCTVSLGGSLCLNIHRCKPDGALDPVPAWRILQEPRSLLITTDELYTDYLHGIDDIGEDVDLGPETVANWDLLGSHDDFAAGQNSRTLRTSLTYRDVLKVSKMGAKLGMLLTKK